MSNNRKPSHRLSFNDAILVWKRYIQKDFVQRVAADFDCNVARIYDVVRGKLHPGSKEQAILQLELENKELAAQLRAFVFKPKEAANDNQLDLFDDAKH
jgi:hypothetical protein